MSTNNNNHNKGDENNHHEDTNNGRKMIKGESSKGFSLETLPVGYRFIPTDKELYCDYLTKKLKGEPLPPNPIRELQLYNYHPQDIFGPCNREKESERYYFTHRTRKYPNGSRPCRRAGEGHWRPTGTDRKTPLGDNRTGSKKSLDYVSGKKPNEIKTHWKMHEYSIELDNQPRKLDNYVLCKIYNKKLVKKQNEEIEEDEEEVNNEEEPAAVNSSTNEVSVPKDNFIVQPTRSNHHLLSNQPQNSTIPLQNHHFTTHNFSPLRPPVPAYNSSPLRPPFYNLYNPRPHSPFMLHDILNLRCYDYGMPFQMSELYRFSIGAQNYRADASYMELAAANYSMTSSSNMELGAANNSISSDSASSSRQHCYGDGASIRWPAANPLLYSEPTYPSLQHCYGDGASTDPSTAAINNLLSDEFTDPSLQQPYGVGASIKGPATNPLRIEPPYPLLQQYYVDERSMEVAAVLSSETASSLQRSNVDRASTELRQHVQADEPSSSTSQPPINHQSSQVPPPKNQNPQPSNGNGRCGSGDLSYYLWS